MPISHLPLAPNKALIWIDRLLPWSIFFTLASFIVGLYLACFGSPADYQQGETVRIMYIHVPAAWMALMLYTLLGGASAVFLIWRVSIAEVIARSVALIGASYALITLVTGALWGYPMWGTWWVWDARLTSMFILFLFYISYLALQSTLPSTTQSSTALAVLAIMGLINVPIVKFSVNFWNSLHQPASVFRLSGPSIHASMLWPLVVMGIANLGLSFTLLLLRMKTLLFMRKIRRFYLS